MDIKQQIDGLTEQEAKAALFYLLENNAENLATPFENELQYEREIDVHMSYILDDALNEAMRHYAEAHGCSELKDGVMGVRPLPCVRDEHGEIREQTVKQLFAKIDEELNELKDSVVYGVDSSRLLSVARDKTFCPEYIAEEAADTITAITTMLEALGIDAGMRDEAQRRVNRRNRERGRL